MGQVGIWQRRHLHRTVEGAPPAGVHIHQPVGVSDTWQYRAILKTIERTATLAMSLRWHKGDHVGILWVTADAPQQEKAIVVYLDSRLPFQ